MPRERDTAPVRPAEEPSSNCFADRDGGIEGGECGRYLL